MKYGNKEKQNLIKNKGITLIALVITIIVLLLLAGLSIATLSGENGIVTQVDKAKTENTVGKEIDEIGLAYNGIKIEKNGESVTAEDLNSEFVTNQTNATASGNNPIIVKFTETGNEYIIDSNGKIIKGTGETTPYLPASDFSLKAGTNLNTGLVTQDSNGNSYVWVEVPKSIFVTATSNTDYTNIEKDMHTYVADYRGDYTDSYYSESGLIESQYNNLKNTMLKSIYENGGFWISQYEIGSDIFVSKKPETETRIPVSKEGAYVYNYVTCPKAQELATSMNSGTRTTSLLFGIQWDLTLKFIETKGNKTQEQIKVDSTQWGNYKNATFEITRGKYSENYGSSYIQASGSYTKLKGTPLLLTTGATERNSCLNIYDLAGNVWEWTLESANDDTYPCCDRAGGYNSDESQLKPAAIRCYEAQNIGYSSLGFRVALY